MCRLPDTIGAASCKRSLIVHLDLILRAWSCESRDLPSCITGDGNEDNDEADSDHDVLDRHILYSVLFVRRNERVEGS